MKVIAAENESGSLGRFSPHFCSQGKCFTRALKKSMSKEIEWA